MIKTFILVIFFIFSLTIKVFTENDSLDTQYQINKLINDKCLNFVPLSYYFLIYDRMAWISSDLVMKEPEEILTNLGREWFCYMDKNNQWHAIYGKYTDQSYKVGLHYISDSNLRNIRKTNIIEEEFYKYYGKCINWAYEELVKDSVRFNISYNHYLKLDSLNNISIWIFPAFQSDHRAIYGSEYYFHFDSKAQNILEKKIDKGKLRYFNPDTSEVIILNYSNYDTPPLSSIFFAIYYEKYFKSIKISTKNMYHLISDGILISIIKEE